MKNKNKNEKLYTANRPDGQMALIAKPNLVPRPYGLRMRLGKTHIVDMREHNGPKHRGYEVAQGSEAQGI